MTESFLTKWERVIKETNMRPDERPVLVMVDPPQPAEGAYAEGHRQGYEDGFRQAAAILEIERDGWKKDESNHAKACADALTFCWNRMNSFLAGRQRRGAR